MRIVASSAMLVVFLSQAPVSHAQTPFLNPLFPVDVEQGVVFGSGTVGVPGSPHSIDLALDVFRPIGVSSSSPLPAIVLVHGGGFVGGDRSSLSFLASDFAQRGYVAFTIDYRTYDEGISDETGLLQSEFDPWAVFDGQANPVERSIGFSAAINDAAKALDWLQLHAGDYNVDVDKVLIGGGSAGARVALAVGLAERSNQIAGVLSLLGSIDNNEDVVDPSDPPFVMFNGVNDHLADYTSAVILADLAQAFSVPFNLYLGDAGHDATDFFLPPNTGGDSPFQESLNFYYNQLGLSSIQVNVVPEIGSIVYTGVFLLASVLVARRRR